MTRSTPDIRRPDVRAVIRAVAPERSAIVPVSELYRIYRGQMDEQDREPVSQKAFGQALAQCGQRLIVRRIDGRNVRCRVMHEKFMAPPEHDTEPARI